MMMEVCKEVVQCTAGKVQGAAISEPASFDVKGRPNEGLAKVHHVGAWTIRKGVSDHHKYVRSNKVTTNKSTNSSVFRRLKIASLLQEHLIANYETLKDSTKYPETLTLKEDRQFCNRGLTRIEDHAYEFLLEEEVARMIISCHCSTRI